MDAKQAKELIIFVAGGVTYEESKFVASMQQQYPNLRVFLGGNGVLNSGQFLEGLGARHRMSQR